MVNSRRPETTSLEKRGRNDFYSKIFAIGHFRAANKWTFEFLPSTTGINVTRELYLKLIVEKGNLGFVVGLSDASCGSRSGKMSVPYRQSRHFLSGERVATQTVHCLSENSSGVANSGPMIQKLFRGLRIIGRDLNIRPDPVTNPVRRFFFVLSVQSLIESRRILSRTPSGLAGIIRGILNL